MNIEAGTQISRDNFDKLTMNRLARARLVESVVSPIAGENHLKVKLIRRAIFSLLLDARNMGIKIENVDEPVQRLPKLSCED